jgi:hypothetical protein
MIKVIQGSLNATQVLAKMERLVLGKGRWSVEEIGGSFFKQALKRVWVQMTGLPEELRHYPTIWVIGTILWVTKEVDMKFTRAMDRPRFHVIVLDPELIPYSLTLS